MSWLVSQPKGEILDHVVSRVVESGVANDPAAFAREIGPSLASDPALGGMAGIAVLKWLDLGGEDEAVLAWLAEHGPNLDFGAASRHHWSSTRRWSAEDAARVLGGLAVLPRPRDRTGVARELLDRLVVADPDAALALSTEHLPAKERAEWYLSGAMDSRAHGGDAEAALEWVLQHLEDGSNKTAAVGNFLTSIAQTDPVTAMDRAAVLPESMRRATMERIARQWAQRSPQGIVDYLGRTSDPDTQASLAKAAFREFGDRGGGDSHLARALALPEGKVSEEAVTALFSGWSRVNLETASAALASFEPGPLRDTAIAAFVDQAVRTDRAAALAWALDIGDPQKRRGLALRQGRNWLNADRAAATRWIESSEALPEEWKAQLLGSGR